MSNNGLIFCSASPAPQGGCSAFSDNSTDLCLAGSLTQRGNVTIFVAVFRRAPYPAFHGKPPVKIVFSFTHSTMRRVSYFFLGFVIEKNMRIIRNKNSRSANAAAVLGWVFFIYFQSLRYKAVYYSENISLRCSLK
jgi:hypothetical protein